MGAISLSKEEEGSGRGERNSGFKAVRTSPLKDLHTGVLGCGLREAALPASFRTRGSWQGRAASCKSGSPNSHPGNTGHAPCSGNTVCLSDFALLAPPSLGVPSDPAGAGWGKGTHDTAGRRPRGLGEPGQTISGNNTDGLMASFLIWEFPGLEKTSISLPREAAEQLSLKLGWLLRWIQV